MKECPNHGGGFDCTPFCPLCAGEQEVITASYEELRQQILIGIKNLERVNQ